MGRRGGTMGVCDKPWWKRFLPKDFYKVFKHCFLGNTAPCESPHSTRVVFQGTDSGLKSILDLTDAEPYETLRLRLPKASSHRTCTSGGRSLPDTPGVTSKHTDAEAIVSPESFLRVRPSEDAASQPGRFETSDAKSCACIGPNCSPEGGQLPVSGSESRGSTSAASSSRSWRSRSTRSFRGRVKINSTEIPILRLPSPDTGTTEDSISLHGIDLDETQGCHSERKVPWHDTPFQIRLDRLLPPDIDGQEGALQALRALQVRDLNRGALGGTPMTPICGGVSISPIHGVCLAPETESNETAKHKKHDVSPQTPMPTVLISSSESKVSSSDASGSQLDKENLLGEPMRTPAAAVTLSRMMPKNSTTKYLPSRIVPCHLTPFHERLEKALRNGDDSI
ncbi:hypothetical protein CYMTET_20417 [Cymbomonas tetramitiformis]|uniref:Uncharacterized protein n=1 Tax=Cymbomonas tetramitiformis TaxID=36881 RepID=A0AAE0L4B2_9CHLO|nr:hypothetical protein CYMTET_20417 [Cymbomonas tetramitiformis]